MRLYPIALKLSERQAVVVGGGTIAARKVGSLLECGAKVTVVSPELCPELEERAVAGEITVLRRCFEGADLDSAMVAIAATNLTAVNEAVLEAGRARRVLVNVVDVPDLCDFYVPASIKRGDLEITINTGGSCPALSKKLRQQLEPLFGPEYGPYLELLSIMRRELRQRIPDQKMRAKAEEAFLATAALALVAEGRSEDAEAVLRACITEYAAQGGAI
jgi:precorrin-2 dehydrogenase/sirohydrochlorin ferrochelatase